MTTASQGEGGLPINIRPFLGSGTPILGYRVGQTGKSEILMLGPIPKSQYPSRWLGRKVGIACLGQNFLRLRRAEGRLRRLTGGGAADAN